MIEYTLTMNSDQARMCLNAVELLMRLKINQPDQISWAVMPHEYWEDGEVNDEKFDDFLHRRDKADEYLRLAFREIFPSWEGVKKDAEWYTLYNLYQVLRYQIHLAEYPDSTGVDSRPPWAFTDEPLPGGSWREVDEPKETKVSKKKGGDKQWKWQ